MIPEQMAQLSNLLFVMAVIFALIAAVMFFTMDYRKKTNRKRRKRNEQTAPPVTVELTPRATYDLDRTEQLSQSKSTEWELLQDITYIHTDASIHK